MFVVILNLDPIEYESTYEYIAHIELDPFIFVPAMNLLRLVPFHWSTTSDANFKFFD